MKNEFSYSSWLSREMPRRHRKWFSIRTHADGPRPYTSYHWTHGDFFDNSGESSWEVRAYADGTLERYYGVMSNSNRAYRPWGPTSETFWPPSHPAAKCIYRPWLA